MFNSKHLKKIYFIIALLLAITVTIAGGLKLVVYILLFITGIFLGIKYKSIKQLYDDYKLGLRINSILVHSEEIEKIKDENEQLKNELKTMTERLNLYKASQQRRVQTNDYFDRNGSARVWENSEIN